MGLQEIRSVVSRLGHQDGTERIFLFGSYARGDMTDVSDIDLRIDKGRIRGLEMHRELSLTTSDNSLMTYVYRVFFSKMIPDRKIYSIPCFCAILNYKMIEEVFLYGIHLKAI